MEVAQLVGIIILCAVVALLMIFVILSLMFYLQEDFSLFHLL